MTDWMICAQPRCTSSRPPAHAYLAALNGTQAGIRLPPPGFHRLLDGDRPTGSVKIAADMGAPDTRFSRSAGRS